MAVDFFLMGLHQELPVYKACYDLLLEIFLFTKDFSREYKFTVGESLKKETHSLQNAEFKALNCWAKHLLRPFIFVAYAT